MFQFANKRNDQLKMKKIRAMKEKKMREKYMQTMKSGLENDTFIYRPMYENKINDHKKYNISGLFKNYNSPINSTKIENDNDNETIISDVWDNVSVISELLDNEPILLENKLYPESYKNSNLFQYKKQNDGYVKNNINELLCNEIKISKEPEAIYNLNYNVPNNFPIKSSANNQFKKDVEMYLDNVVVVTEVPVEVATELVTEVPVEVATEVGNKVEKYEFPFLLENNCHKKNAEYKLFYNKMI